MPGRVLPRKWKGVFVASRIDREQREAACDWRLDALAGRLVEISGSEAPASLTTAAALIHEAQQRGEPTAWIAGDGSTFYPPDFAAFGIDLDALPVIRAGNLTKAARIADRLLRSGGFAALVLDLGDAAQIPIPMQTRLAGLAKKHDTALLCITRKDARAPSLGSLISIRGDVARCRAGFDSFVCELRVLKDKRRGPGRRHRETYRGPGGLC